MLVFGLLLVVPCSFWEACPTPWLGELQLQESQAISTVEGQPTSNVEGGSSSGMLAIQGFEVAAEFPEPDGGSRKAAAVAPLASPSEDGASKATMAAPTTALTAAPTPASPVEEMQVSSVDAAAAPEPAGNVPRSTTAPSGEGDDNDDEDSAEEEEGGGSGLGATTAAPAAVPTARGAAFESEAADHLAEGASDNAEPLLSRGFGKWRQGHALTWAQTCKPYPGKRVILVQANSQYEDFFRNWLFHAAKLWNSETDQLVVAAESNVSAVRLRSLSGLFGVHWDVQFIGSTGESLQADAYGTGTWTKVVTHRPAQIMRLLNLGCSVLYSDIDIAWVKPVWPAIDASGKFDTYAASDGGSKDRCTCTLYMHPTVANNDLMERWIDKLKGQAINQRAFNDVLTQMVKQKKIDFKVLPTGPFPNGRQAFGKNKKPTNALKKAVAVHANYIQGSGNKRDLLIAAGYWNPCGNNDTNCTMRVHS